jgi:hypothetical protein
MPSIATRVYSCGTFCSCAAYVWLGFPDIISGDPANDLVSLSVYGCDAQGLEVVGGTTSVAFPRAFWNPTGSSVTPVSALSPFAVVGKFPAITLFLRSSVVGTLGLDALQQHAGRSLVPVVL